MADRDRMSRNGGMNDGTYRIEISGDETWNGRALHYMRRDELMYMWTTMEERRRQLRPPIPPLPDGGVNPGGAGQHPSAPGNSATV